MASAFAYSAASDPNRHTIASYNMSWANSAGFHTGIDPVTKLDDPHTLRDEHEVPTRACVTEYFFIKRAKKAFEFWNHALEHLNDFVVAKNPSFIGIQEAGLVGQIKSRPCFASGTYNFEESKQGFETIVTIWRKDLGEKVEIINDDAGIKISGEVGRPITGIYTTEGFLLINCHLPWGEDKNSKDKWFKRAQQTYLSNFIQPFFDKYPINLSKIFIVGDFNYESYLASAPLQLRQVTLTGGNSAPAASCCHTERRNRVDDYVRGNDYCFGLNVSEQLQVAKSPFDETGVYGIPGGSIASDHELVYATFVSSSVAGGQRVRRVRRTGRTRRTHRAHYNNRGHWLPSGWLRSRTSRKIPRL